MTNTRNNSIRLAAVGDLLLTTQPGSARPGRGLEALSEDIRELFASCDIVLANLECTLPGSRSVATEPRVFTTEDQVQSLKASRINLVCLANNHAFDAFDEGYHKLTRLLDSLQIGWFGAGLNRNQALQPNVMEFQGVRLAFVGVVDETSGMDLFAGPQTSGVAPLEVERLHQHIQDLKRDVDHVIVSPHWGHERFRFPSPTQVQQARTLVEHGASMILGHHPHVIQGLEWHQGAPVMYSLGNFFPNHVYWDNGNTLTWNRFERTGCILLVEIDKHRVCSAQQIPVLDNGSAITIDTSGLGERFLQKANHQLTRGISAQRYQREAFRVQRLKPVLAQLRWSRLRTVRPRDVRKAMHLLFSKSSG